MGARLRGCQGVRHTGVRAVGLEAPRRFRPEGREILPRLFAASVRRDGEDLACRVGKTRRAM